MQFSLLFYKSGELFDWKHYMCPKVVYSVFGRSSVANRKILIDCVHQKGLTQVAIFDL